MILKDLVEDKMQGIDFSRVKMIRHKDSSNKDNILEIFKNGEIETYQKYQSSDIFKDCDFVMSFIGLEGTLCKFIGLYKVGEIKEKVSKNFPNINNDPSIFVQGNEYFYYKDMKKSSELEIFEDRLVIDWGRAALSWHQWFNKGEKKVYQILPKGFFKEFPGIKNIVLDFKELQKLIENGDANLEWKTTLSSIKGIYAILDNHSKNGKNLYIGSAAGKNGIWQRWEEYSKTGHGGNLILKDILDEDINKDRTKYFQFSILESLPISTPIEEVIRVEELYKKKLKPYLNGEIERSIDENIFKQVYSGSPELDTKDIKRIRKLQKEITQKEIIDFVNILEKSYNLKFQENSEGPLMISSFCLALEKYYGLSQENIVILLKNAIKKGIS